MAKLCMNPNLEVAMNLARDWTASAWRDTETGLDNFLKVADDRFVEEIVRTMQKGLTGTTCEMELTETDLGILANFAILEKFLAEDEPRPEFSMEVARRCLADTPRDTPPAPSRLWQLFVCQLLLCKEKLPPPFRIWGLLAERAVVAYIYGRIDHVYQVFNENKGPFSKRQAVPGGEGMVPNFTLVAREPGLDPGALARSLIMDLLAGTCGCWEGVRQQDREKSKEKCLTRHRLEQWLRALPEADLWRFLDRAVLGFSHKSFNHGGFWGGMLASQLRRFIMRGNVAQYACGKVACPLGGITGMPCHDKDCPVALSPAKVPMFANVDWVIVRESAVCNHCDRRAWGSEEIAKPCPELTCGEESQYECRPFPFKEVELWKCPFCSDTKPRAFGTRPMTTDEREADDGFAVHENQAAEASGDEADSEGENSRGKRPRTTKPSKTDWFFMAEKCLADCQSSGDHDQCPECLRSPHQPGRKPRSCHYYVYDRSAIAGDLPPADPEPLGTAGSPSAAELSEALRLIADRFADWRKHVCLAFTSDLEFACLFLPPAGKQPRANSSHFGELLSKIRADAPGRPRNAEHLQSLWKAVCESIVALLRHYLDRDSYNLKPL